MSRIRMIKPAFFKHADLYDAEVTSQLPLRVAFSGLWTVADRRGVFAWSRNIKPDVLPYDPCDMLVVLEALAAAGFVQRYEFGGKSYGFIPSFESHQTFHKNEKESPVPAPSLHGASTVQAPEQHSSRPAVSITGTSTGTVKSPPTARAVSSVEGELKAQAGEHGVQIFAFLDERPGSLRDEWAGTLLQLIGPATGNLPEDLAQACVDGKLANPPVTNAHALRAFVAKCREARVRGSPPGREGASGKTSDDGEAGRIFAAIRALITETPNPGRGMIRSIRKADVEKLGPAAIAAYEQVGGAARFTDQEEKVGFLLRDFIIAYRRSAA